MDIRAGNSIFFLGRQKMNIIQHSDWSYDAKMLEAVAVFKLDVQKIACKAKWFVIGEICTIELDS